MNFFYITVSLRFAISKPFCILKFFSLTRISFISVFMLFPILCSFSSKGSFVFLTNFSRRFFIFFHIVVVCVRTFILRTVIKTLLQISKLEFNVLNVKFRSKFNHGCFQETRAHEAFNFSFKIFKVRL